MDKATRNRWIVLLSALLLTLVAVFYPVDDGTTPRATAMPSSPAPKLSLVPLPPSESAEEERLGDPDPFSPRGWQAPPPPAPAPVAAAPVSTAPVAPAPPPGPPPLPFRFVGSLNDGGDQIVYLARGDEALVVRAGEVLERTYKVSAITASQIEFEHLPTGQKQTLALPARDN